MNVASLVPSLTELLFTLDLGDNLVARTGFCVHPHDRVRRVPKVGGTKDVDLAKVLAAKPTHLVVNIDENDREQVAALRKSIPHVVVTHPLTPDDNLMLYREFGRVFHRTMQANALATQYTEARNQLCWYTTEWRPRDVLYLIWKDPWFTISPPTYISAMLALANLRTLPTHAAVRYPVLKADDPVWQAADAILLPSEPYAFRTRHADELADQFPGKPVLLVDGELLSWYGSRAIEGLRYLQMLRTQIDRGLATV
jgi:ABC-type Fe3+-hydroxamate transport system substrate-binding protein